MKGNLHQQLAALEELLRMGEEARQIGARAVAESDEADPETGEGMSEEDMQAFQAQIEEIARLQQRLMGKSARSADITGAFARDPMDADEAEQMWDEFVRWAEQFSDPVGSVSDSVQDYVSGARDDFDYAAPRGRATAQQAIANYQRYIEANYERGKAAKGDVIYGRFGSGGEDDDGGQPAGSATEFFGDRTTEDDGASVTVDALFADYVSWCEGQELRPVSESEFLSQLSDLGVRRQRIAGADRFIGVAMKAAKSTSAHLLYA